MTAKAVAEKSEAPVDVEAILPNPKALVIGGIPCTVRRLKVWEYIKGINVLTAGVGAAFPNIRFDTSSDEALQQSVLALIITAAPRAVDELKEFTTMVVDPKDDKDRSKLAAYIANDLEVMEFMDIGSVIALQEKDELRELVGKVPATFKMVSAQVR